MSEDRIEQARQHVIAGRRIVHRQRERMARGEVKGLDAQRLLQTFETSLKIFEEDLARLLNQQPIGGSGSADHDPSGGVVGELQISRPAARLRS